MKKMSQAPQYPLAVFLHELKKEETRKLEAEHEREKLKDPEKLAQMKLTTSAAGSTTSTPRTDRVLDGAG